MTRAWGVLVLVLAAGVLGGGVGGAQVESLQDGRGTPGATSPLPGASACTVAPRTPGELRALAPGGRRGEGPVGPAVVVDRVVIEEVTAAIRLYVACLNTGDDLRLYAMMTDDRVRTIPSGDGYLVDDGAAIEARATPIAIRWGYDWPMPSVLAVTALPDGRVAAEIAFSRPEGTTRRTLVWAELGGRWLVDEEREGGAEELRPRDVEDFQA